MAKIIAASIDFRKMKSAVFTTPKGTKCILIPIDQDGIIVTETGQFLNFTIHCNDEANEYKQDTSLSLKQTKEQTERKDKKVYIGNGIIVWSSEGKPTTPTPAQEANVEPEHLGNEDDLPF